MAKNIPKVNIMQIVIPMSGFGERFRRAGYDVPKPLIEIDGKPIIAHVIDMFPDETDFLLICNQDHLDNPVYGMEYILRQYCPSCRIVGIPAHKLGPIHAVQQVRHLIDPERPVIVNYCDFTCYWDWYDFKKTVASNGCVGAIPAYKGFHPHTLGNTNYAYMVEANGWVKDIQEKQPYTENRMQEFASSGTYYFASGKIMDDAFLATVNQKLEVGGEYYVSLAYKTLLLAGEPVAVYPLQYFMQWGTPQDVAEYNGWSQSFRQLVSPNQKTGNSISGFVVMPMAGLGQRFVVEGYQVAKPLILVSGEPMVLQATSYLAAGDKHAFVVREDMLGYQEIVKELKNKYPNAVIETISGVTEGQACTALIGLDALERAGGEAQGPVTFGACDCGVLYDHDKFKKLVDDVDNVDVIVWAVRGHANAVRKPEMFGWIEAQEDGQIQKISVKAPFGSPSKDPIVLGIFTFRRAGDFRRVVTHLIGRDGRVNGEFYIDTCINDAIELGLRCHLFEVDSFMSFGTPNDLRTFEYWQSCFHKWDSHPYRLELDNRISDDAVAMLEKQYNSNFKSDL